MPSCAVVTCHNRSELVTLASNGITFHRFPCTPKVKEKWINATGRGPVWWPLKSSTICSVHFKENEFRPLPKSRRLFDWAVPTQKLPQIHISSPSHNLTSKSIDVEDINNSSDIVGPDYSTVTKSVNKVSNLIRSNKTYLADSGQPASSTHKDMDMKFAEPPRKTRQIESYKALIKHQYKKIRTLQKKNSWYRKKYNNLKKKLKELREKIIDNSD